MINFTYYSPTKVIFGKNTEELAGKEIARLGYKKALIHYGGESARASGLLEKMEKALRDADIDYVLLGGVKPNPRLGLAMEGVELCKREHVDFILAVGGGSVIDSAKAIAYGICNEFDIWDLYQKKQKAAACAPVGVVLTIAASGSETSGSSVLTNGKLKNGYNNDLSRPRFAIMNPELTYTLPKFQTSCGIVDILMHTMDRYFSNDKETELVDRISEGLMTTVLHRGPRALQNPQDYDARAELMWAGSLSHNGLTGTGRASDCACHAIEHKLSGLFDVAHGAGLSAVWSSWARHVYRHDLSRFVRFAVNVMGLDMDYHVPERTALEGIAAMENFFRSINMPVSIPELIGRKATEQELDTMAKLCGSTPSGVVGTFVKLGREDVARIYKMSNDN